MKVFLIAATILFLPSMLSLRTKTVDQEQRSNQKVLTVEDFVKGQIDRGSGRESLTLMIQINQRLPPYKFHLIPDLTVSDSPGSDNPSHHVGWIEISVGESISTLQKIDVRTKSGGSSFTKSFQAEDVNFDGFLDIAVLYDFGAKWSILNYWLFDKRTGRFITSPLTQELKRISHSLTICSAAFGLMNEFAFVPYPKRRAGREVLHACFFNPAKFPRTLSGW